MKHVEFKEVEVGGRFYTCEGRGERIKLCIKLSDTEGEDVLEAIEFNLSPKGLVMIDYEI